MSAAIKSRRLFHYTVGQNFSKILNTRVIKLATEFLPAGEKPAAWFSFAQDWEPTATKLWMENGKLRQLTFAEMLEVCIPFQIEIDPKAAPWNWTGWRKLSGAHNQTVKMLETEAIRKKSNIRDYQVSFDPVTIEHWLAIEYFVNGEWQAFEKLPKVSGLEHGNEGQLPTNAEVAA